MPTTMINKCLTAVGGIKIICSGFQNDAVVVGCSNRQNKTITFITTTEITILYLILIRVEINI